MNPLDWMFDAASFSPRSMCGPGWTENLVNASVAANAAIWLSYWWIAAQFVGFWRNVRGRIGAAWIILAIASFVFACGTTHLDDVLVFRWPAYRYFALNDSITAALSVATALVLGPVLVYLSGLPSPEDLRREIETKDRAIAVADKALADKDEAYRELNRLRMDDVNRALFYKAKLEVLESRLSDRVSDAERAGLIESVRDMLRVAQVTGGPRDDDPR